MTARRAGERAVIPLFPLSTVLVPGLVLPLHIFEPRYRRLLADLSARPADERGFGVVALREGHEVGERGARALHDVGTLALLREVSTYPDGRSDIVTNGDARFRLLRLVEPGTPYLCGEVEWLDEPEGAAEGTTAALAEDVARRFDEYRASVAGSGAVEAAQMAALSSDPRTLSYLVAAAMVLDLRDRQTLLGAESTADRLRQERTLLSRETALLQVLPSLPAVDLARTPSGWN